LGRVGVRVIRVKVIRVRVRVIRVRVWVRVRPEAPRPAASAQRAA
jgi:hypothetical protein